MKSVMAMSVIGAVAVGATLCATGWAAGAPAPEKAAKSALPIIPGAAEVEGGKSVHHSTDFGWAANQDVTEQFAKLLQSGQLKAGDELVLDHTYRISIGGSHKLPANFTLSAVKGAGLAVTGPAGKYVPTPLLELADGSALRNLTITYLDTPPLGPTGEEHGVNFFDWTGIRANGKKDLLIENCEFIGQVDHHIKMQYCSGVKVIGCHIAGGHWSVYLIGVTDAVFRRCLIEKCAGDSIKCGISKGLVEDCVFQDNLRDGIDTTGGFRDCVVRNTIFRRLRGTGMDIKSFYEFNPGQNVDLSPRNVHVLVEKCQFYDVPNAIAFTTIDGGRRKGPGNEYLNAGNMKECAPHDIDVNDCIVGHVEEPRRPSEKGGYCVDYPKQGECMRMFYLKDAYGIRYRNARFFGDRITPVGFRSDGGSRQLTKEAADALKGLAPESIIAGNVLPEPAPPIKPGVREAPFARGPQ